MKMRLALLILSAGVMGQSAFAQSVAIAKAAELGCHRVERLVDLGRIDAAYLNKFHSLKIAPGTAGGAAFVWSGRQSPGADGTASTIELNQDATGKIIGNPVLVTGASAGGPVWPDKDPVTLMETALHYVLENGTTNADVEPFLNALSEGTILQVEQGGKPLAQVRFSNSRDGRVLEVMLGLDATLLSTSVK